MSRSDARNLEAISKAIDQHNASCPFPAVAVCLSPFEFERLGWDTIRGLPIREDPNLGTGRFRIVCARDESGLDEEVEVVAEERVPVEVPARPVGLTLA